MDQLAPHRAEADVERAISALLSEFGWNSWFVDSFWPENEHRVRLILDDVLFRSPAPAKLLDIGCANGFLSLLFQSLGYEVTATDSWDVPERPALFAKHGIHFFYSNLNTPKAFETVSGGAFEVVVMGEIIEHILNHPLGLMREVSRTLRPGGLLVLTTPNPSTAINAVRVLRDSASLWGTDAFLDLPKVVDGKITDIGDVHFREYRTSELDRLLSAAGFTIEEVRYFAFGVSRQQPTLKRWAKTNPLANVLMRHRLFGANQYVLATRNRPTPSDPRVPEG